MVMARRRQKKQKKNKVEAGPRGNIFERANRTLNETEGSIINLIAAVAPWGAPLAPATMMWAGLVNRLHFPRGIATVVAVVVESLGLVTVHTAVQFWQHNRHYKATERRVPFWWAIGMFGMYLAVVLSVNVLLEVFADPVPVPVSVIVRGLVSLLAVPAAVTLALRALHVDMVAEWAREVAKAQATRVANKEAENKAVAQGSATSGATVAPPEKVNRSALVRELHVANPTWDRKTLAEQAHVSHQLVSRVLGPDGKPK